MINEIDHNRLQAMHENVRGPPAIDDKAVQALRGLLLSELGIAYDGIAGKRPTNAPSSSAEANTRYLELRTRLQDCDGNLAALQVEHDAIMLRLQEIAIEMEAIRLSRQETALALSSVSQPEEDGGEDTLRSARIEDSVQSMLNLILTLQQASRDAVMQRPREGRLPI